MGKCLPNGVAASAARACWRVFARVRTHMKRAARSAIPPTTPTTIPTIKGVREDGLEDELTLLPDAPPVGELEICVLNVCDPEVWESDVCEP